MLHPNELGEDINELYIDLDPMDMSMILKK